MSVYTNPPEWEAQGKKPPSSKRTEGWKPGDRVPASWLNWFWFSTVNSLQQIAQAFVNHRDASAPHDGHETKEGATAKVEAHSQKTTAVHGVEAGFFVAKTSRPDQRVGWQDIVDKPSEYPPVVHDHDDRYYTKAQSDGRYAPKQHSHGAGDLPQASLTQQGIVQLTNSRSSTSETLAVTAKALNDHRNSADHDDRYYTKAQSDGRYAPKQHSHGAGDLPQASLTQQGIVQLTNSRSSTSETLAVTAKALNDHRNSADHDDRYYTKSQVDNLVASGGIQWIVPGNTVLAESLSAEFSTTSETWKTLKRFVVSMPGRYRITGEFMHSLGGTSNTATIGIRIGQSVLFTQSTTSYYYQPFSFDMPSNVVLGIGDVIEVVGSGDGYASCVVRNVRVRGDVGSPPSWVVRET